MTNNCSLPARKAYEGRAEISIVLWINFLTLHSQNRAYILFARAADMGNLKAMEKMADALLFGSFGMQNITAAIRLYEYLAKEGSHKAQNVSFKRQWFFFNSYILNWHKYVEGEKK